MSRILSSAIIYKPQTMAKKRLIDESFYFWIPKKSHKEIPTMVLETIFQETQQYLQETQQDTPITVRK